MKKVYREYTNGIITVEWRSELCDHSAVCINELPEVFNMLHIPWVDMSGASTEEIMSVVDACPTRALAWRYNDPAKNSEKQSEEAVEYLPSEEEAILPETQVALMKDGPAVIKGNFSIKMEDGSIVKKKGVISICRCGISEKMPWCDGAHFRLKKEDNK